jgi:hypothetical protein
LQKESPKSINSFQSTRGGITDSGSALEDKGAWLKPLGMKIKLFYIGPFWRKLSVLEANVFFVGIFYEKHLYFLEKNGTFWRKCDFSLK